MTTVIPQSPPQGAVKRVVYPDSDGKPMADNTLQWEWIATIKNGLEVLFRDRPDVFVAGDLLWYPVEGDPKTRVAPDVMVAFGRPKGYRGSYRQWEEGGVTPQVVFEIVSPGNRGAEMVRKFRLYERLNVEEYYLFDPGDAPDNFIATALSGWRRSDAASGFEEIDPMNGWRSPRLGISFLFDETSGLRLIRPDGKPFETYVELALRAEQEHQRAEREHQRIERLTAQLRAAGIEPDVAG